MPKRPRGNSNNIESNDNESIFTDIIDDFSGNEVNFFGLKEWKTVISRTLSQTEGNYAANVRNLPDIVCALQTL